MEPVHVEALEALRAAMKARLALDLREFYTHEEMLDAWIIPGLAEGQTAAEIAAGFCVHFHDKYDLEWLRQTPYSY